MSTSFRRASTRRTRIKAALCGPSKSGKTYGAIYLADCFLKRLADAGYPAGNGRIAVIDSENGRSEYYGIPEGGSPGPGQFDFDIYDLYQVKPESYVDAFNEAARGGYGLIIGPRATREELAEFREKLIADPANYISQPMVKLSVSPILVDHKLGPRHVDLRPFAVTGKDTWVLPGGLTRVALREGSLVVNSSQGGGSKDTWVLE